MFIANDSSMNEVHICSIPHKRMSKQKKYMINSFFFNYNCLKNNTKIFLGMAVVDPEEGPGGPGPPYF